MRRSLASPTRFVAANTEGCHLGTCVGLVFRPGVRAGCRPLASLHNYSSKLNHKDYKQRQMTVSYLFSSFVALRVLKAVGTSGSSYSEDFNYLRRVSVKIR